MIEESNFFSNRGVDQELFEQMPLKESISGKKALPCGRSANFAKFEDDDKVEHN